METSLAGASASDNYIYKWECSYSFIKSFCLLLIFLCTQFILLCQVMGPAPETNINMSDALHFPKLNGPNYDSWAASMKSALQSQFLWLYGEEDMPTVVKSIPPSSDRTSTEYKSWKKDREQYKTWLRMDSTTMGLLNGSIDSILLSLVISQTCLLQRRSGILFIRSMSKTNNALMFMHL